MAAAAAAKPDVIKIRVDDNLGAAAKMPPEVYRAVIDEAHRLGLRVAAHIFYLEDAKGVPRAGADFIAHSVRDREIDGDFVALMKARDVPYCPTLTRELSTFVYGAVPEFFSDPFSCARPTARSSPSWRRPSGRRRCAGRKAPGPTRRHSPSPG